MALYRDSLPQLTGDFFLTDAGIETDIIFNKGVEIREFAAHTSLSPRRWMPVFSLIVRRGRPTCTGPMI